MERMGRALVSAERSDVHFTVIASEGLEGLPSHVEVVRLALPRRPAFARILWFYVRSGRLVRQWRDRVDVVHSCGALTTPCVEIATVHLCQAAVPAVHDTTSRRWRRLNAALARVVGRAIERRQFRVGRVGTLVAVSDAVATQLARCYPDLPQTTIVNGVDTARFDVPHRAGRDGDPLTVVMVTGDFALKGVDLAITSLQDAPGVVLRVVGEGALAPYRDLAASLGVADRVKFYGYQERPADIYASSDVVLCVSLYESFGLYLVEAALAGCGVIATDVGVAAQLIGPGDGGLLIERSATALSRALTEAATDRERMRSWASVAHERAAGFSLDTMVATYDRLYHEIAAR